MKKYDSIFARNKFDIGRVKNQDYWKINIFQKTPIGVQVQIE